MFLWDSSWENLLGLQIPRNLCQTFPMKHILAPMLLMVFLCPSLALSEEVLWYDLVETDSLYYKKFTDVPFTGKVMGSERGSFKKGKREGPWVSYHDNGQLYWKRTYKNGEFEGRWVRYFPNGQLKEKGDYKNGRGEGSWVYYNENGQLECKGKYKNGLREGPWEFYDEDGKEKLSTGGYYGLKDSWWRSVSGTYKNNVKID